MTAELMLKLREHPGRKPVMYQSWQQLLFLHWKFPVREVQKLLPPGLFVDAFEEHAYVGIVPFYMRNIRYRFTPAIPWLSNFLELNVRTYVKDEHGVPGVWFFSLDCNQPVAVWVARNRFHLPYFHATMSASQDAKHCIDYSSERRSNDAVESSSRFRYTKVGQVKQAVPGTIEFFLVERYLLFAANSNGKLYKGRVHHTPYPIQQVAIEACHTDLFQRNRFPTPESDFCHAIGSTGVDVEVFSLEH